MNIEFKLRRKIESTVIVAGEKRFVKETVDFDMCYDPESGDCWFVGKNSTPFSLTRYTASQIEGLHGLGKKNIEPKPYIRYKILKGKTGSRGALGNHPYIFNPNTKELYLVEEFSESIIEQLDTSEEIVQDLMKKSLKLLRKNVILFDLDMTLVDTSSLLNMRKSGKWKSINNHFNSTKIFPRVKEVIDNLQRFYQLAVVTSSPRSYAEDLLQYHEIKIPVVSAYHDTEKHKPEPDPFLFAIEKLQLDPKKDVIITIGDDINDINASIAVNQYYGVNPTHSLDNNFQENGVNAYGVPFGEYSKSELHKSGAIWVMDKFSELNFLTKFYNDNEQIASTSDLIKDQILIQDTSGKFPEFKGVYYLGYYHKPSSSRNDEVSMQLLKFKGGDETAVSKWCKIASDSLSGIIDVDIIIRSLSSKETDVSLNGDTPLDKLVRTLGDSLPADNIHDVLTKSRKTKPLKYLGKEERYKEINGVYNYSSNYGKKYKQPNILVVDDVLTTGTTLREINRAIGASIKNYNLYVFTFLRAFDKRSPEGQSNKLLSENFTDENSQKNGRMFHRYSSGSTYDGEWKDNKRHGFGIQIWPNGRRYEGFWEYNNRHGQGTCHYPQGSEKGMYQGEWENDKYNGQGVLRYSNGDMYQGEWKDGHINGQGVLRYSNGDMYQGEWKDGHINGQGTYVHHVGDLYIGEWKDGRYHDGKGLYFNKKGELCEGEWEYGSLKKRLDNWDR